MKQKILSWNVRGFNNPHKRERVKFWLRQWQCNIVCLQETKLGSPDRRVIRSIWGNPYVDWVVLDAVGTTGGVLLMWDKRVVEKIDLFVGRFLYLVFGVVSVMILLGLALSCMVQLVMLQDRICG
jgi:hypothetical protein